MPKLTHGQATRNSYTPEYAAWKSMIQRCTNPNHEFFSHYGGRGIMICERWRKFENFFADMRQRPSATHSFDRIDNDGNYELGNCRWALPGQQQANRRFRRRHIGPVLANGFFYGRQIRWTPDSGSAERSRARRQGLAQ